MEKILLNKIRCAVIGVGHLGRYHAEKYSKIKNCTLVSIVDPDEKYAKDLSKKLKCNYIKDYHNLLGLVDAVSIATPTSLHYEIAAFFLSNEVHVLLEKPITNNVNEAIKLDEISRSKNLVLQIGHLERFNPVTMKFFDIIREDLINKKFKPVYFESTRIGPFSSRATDVSVVIDLMIHDIDLINILSNSKINSIEAIGKSVLSSYTDIANTRIKFDSGCVANITSSRVSDKIERKMKIYTKDKYFSLDFQTKILTGKKLDGKKLSILSNELQTKEFDALEFEITSFIESIISNKPVAVSAMDGINAIRTAFYIEKKIKEIN